MCWCRICLIFCCLSTWIVIFALILFTKKINPPFLVQYDSFSVQASNDIYIYQGDFVIYNNRLFVKSLTSSFQSVRNVTHSKIRVCNSVPPIIPDHIPYIEKFKVQVKLFCFLLYALHYIFLGSAQRSNVCLKNYILFCFRRKIHRFFNYTSEAKPINITRKKVTLITWIGINLTTTAIYREREV
jgi:hypothetical protein